jgi:hypothetical protein
LAGCDRDGTIADPAQPIRQCEGVPFYVVPYVCHHESSLRLRLRAGSRRTEPVMPSSRSVDHAVANNSISSGRVVPKGNNPSYLVLHSLDEVPPFELHVDQLPIVIQTIGSSLPLDEMLCEVHHRWSHNGQGIVVPGHTS